MSKKWTRPELDILQNSSGVVPVIEGRTRSATRDKMVELGLIKIKNVIWTPEEIELVLKGATQIEGRTQQAIQHVKRKLKVSQKIENCVDATTRLQKPNLKWSEENTNTLKDLHEHGYSAKEIFAMNIFEVTENAIQKKLQRLGLSTKKEITKFPNDINNKFNKFLLDNWQGKTPKDLVEIWNKENSLNQINLVKVVDHLNLLEIRIPYNEIQKINNLRKREKELISSNKGSANQLNENIRLERIKLMRSRLLEKRDLWTGLPSEEAKDAEEEYSSYAESV